MVACVAWAQMLGCCSAQLWWGLRTSCSWCVEVWTFSSVSVGTVLVSVVPMLVSMRWVVVWVCLGGGMGLLRVVIATAYSGFFARLWLVIAVSERLAMDGVFCIALVPLLT